MKNLIPKLVKMTEDGVEQVRKISLDLLCKIKDRYGLRILGDRIKNMPQNKIQQIQNYNSGKYANKTPDNEEVLTKNRKLIEI